MGRIGSFPRYWSWEEDREDALPPIEVLFSIQELGGGQGARYMGALLDTGAGRNIRRIRSSIGSSPRYRNYPEDRQYEVTSQGGRVVSVPHWVIQGAKLRGGLTLAIPTSATLQKTTSATPALRGQVRLYQVRLGQVRLGQVRLGQVR